MDKFQFSEAKAKAVMAAKDKVSALMTEFMISTERAQEILDAYFEKYPGVSQFISDTEEFVRRNGYSMSLLGRKRRVPAVDSSDGGVAERAIRQAVNSVIQSIASDGLMVSACNLQEYLDDHPEIPMVILGVCHDCLYVEVREDYFAEGRDLLVRFLTIFPEGIASPIPMVADAEAGRRWSEFSEDFGETLKIASDEFEDEDDEED